jgi:hypothetical protein
MITGLTELTWTHREVLISLLVAKLFKTIEAVVI